MFPIDFLRHAAVATPSRTAVLDGERACSYAELLQRADALAAGLQALAGKARPTVAILGPNSMEMLVALMAIHAGGSILVPLNGRNAKAELDAQILRVRPDVLVVHKRYVEKYSAVDISTVIADADAGDPRAMAALEQTHRGRRAEWTAALTDVNAIKFTGGSSGIPKGVMQSFRSLNTLIASVMITFRFEADERYLCVAPMTHAAGAFILPVLAAGGCVVCSADPKPAPVLDLMAGAGVTAIWMPPTMMYTLIDEQRAQPRALPALRHLIWGGAPAALARLREARHAFGPVVETIFGQTEAPLMLAAARAEDVADEKHLASVGRVGPLAEVGIFSDDGRRLGPNELGEVRARGDLLMNAYLDMPEETAKTLVDGWLHTGDVGYIDEDGYLYLKDRIRDVIISGGFNVYPSDVEAAIAEHPAVSEVVVFGVPDDHWGERVEAAMELRPGCLATQEDLIGYCKERMGSVKTPKRIHFVEALPRSPVGKVLRREARGMAMGLPDPAA
ncbi:MAG: class I adenylate-forming enzyme family protein [Achromobacter veterisilvae]